MDNHQSYPAHRHTPPYLPTLLAGVIASVISLQALADDFNTPLTVSPWENPTAELDDAHVDVSAAQAGVTVNDMVFGMNGGWVHNTGAGGGVLFYLWSGSQDVLQQIEIDSTGGFGVQTNGGPVRILSSQVHTQADNAAGLDAQSGGQFDLQDSSVATEGDNSAAVHAHNNGSAQISGSELSTHGDHSAAVWLDNNGSLTLQDSRITTLGDDSTGIQASNGAALQVSGAVIDTTGQTSHGVHISSNSANNVLKDSSVTTHGDDSIGVIVNNASGAVGVENTQVLTEGQGSHGLYTQQGTHIDLTAGSTVQTRGANADGAWTAEGGSIAIADSQLSSSGTGSAAAHALASGTISVADSQLSSSGSDGAAVQLDNGGRIDASGSQFDSRSGSAILFSQGSQPGNVAQLDMTDSRVTSDGAVVRAQSGSTGVFNAKGSQMQADSAVGYAIADSANLSSTLTDSSLDVGNSGLLANVEGSGVLTLTSQGSDLHGDTQLQDTANGTLDMTLHDARWQMNGDSTLSRLDVDSATVAFGATGFHTLSMTGDLTGAGNFQMNTDLSTLQTDLILVGGQAYGDHTLIIADSGKEAGGDQLRVVGTQGSPGAFSLYGEHVDAGAYRYTLEQQGNDWYLVAAGSNVVDPGEPTDPENPETPSPGPGDTGEPESPAPDPDPGTPGSNGGDQGGNHGGNESGGHTSQPDVISKGSNVALGMQSAAANLYYAELGTLVQRLGELRLSQDEGGVWVRGIGKRVRMGEHYSRAYQQNLEGIEIGADKAIHLDGARLYLGGMVGASQSRLDFKENSRGTLDSTSIGAYATYLRDDGWYVDNVIKYSHMDGDVKVPTNLGKPVKGDYTADAVGVSVEGGKRIDLRNDWFVEPQVQLSATHFQGPSYTSSDGLKVRGSDTDSLQGRVGVRGGHEMQLDKDVRLQAYATASYIDELAGDTSVRVNGQKLHNELPGSRGEVGLGGALQLSHQQKVSLELDYAHGDHLEQPWAVTVGYRYLW